MHGGTRLPPRGGKYRGAVAKTDENTTRAALFSASLPRHASRSIRLPSLIPSVVSSSQGSNNSRNLTEAAAQSARLRYTSSLRKTTHALRNDASFISTSTSPPLTTPPATPTEPVRFSESKDHLLSSSTRFPSTSTKDHSTKRSSSSNLDALLRNQQYAELYLVLSTLLPITSRRLLKEDAHNLRILSYRAICSCALLHFKESAEDGMVCLEIRRQLCQMGCVPSSEDDQRLSARVDECVVRALVMSERYEEADKVANSLRRSSFPSYSFDVNSGGIGDNLFTEGLTAALWQSAIPHIRQFRSAVAAQQWQEALKAVESHDANSAAAESAATACLRASPLCAMLAFVHLEAGHPLTARALLLAYLAGLPEPPKWEWMLTAPSEHEQLWDSFRSYYVFATTLLAKASLMSGSAYLNISAALLQRCLRVLPIYAPARVLSEFVLSYEAHQESLEAAMTRQDFTAALIISARMLTMLESNPVLQGEVYLTRTQVQWLRRLPLEVVREASRCVAADPSCAMAFRLRADALEEMRQVTEAVADRATAAHLNTKTDAAYAELQAQRKRYDEAQKASEAQRRSFAAFAAAAPSTTHFSSGLWGASDSNASINPSDMDAAFQNDSAKAGAGASTFFARTVTTSAEPTLYAVLGVPPHATLSEIRQHYRQLTLQCHPDRVIGASADRRRQASEEFKRVSNAYSVLSDAQKRLEYDASLRARL